MHFLLGGKIRPFNDASPHLLTNSNQSTHYYIVASHQGWVHFVYNTKEEFCIGCIQQRSSE